METKNVKKILKLNQKQKSIRVSIENQKKAKNILNAVNNKKVGRNVKFDQLLQLALGLVTEEHIKMLQDQSISNEERKEFMRQKWISIYGPTTKDEFTGVMLTKEFFSFLESAEESQRFTAKIS